MPNRRRKKSAKVKFQNNQIDAGDYLGESEVQTFESGSYQIDLNLEEIE